MFNRKASSPKSRPDEILKSLSLKPGARIADIGSGGGFFTLRFAEIVGEEGMILAVDTNPQLLEFVAESAKEKGFTNVRTALAGSGAPPLPEGALDLIFMRNVTHHIEERTGYFRAIKHSLAPGGRVAIIEYRGGSHFSFRGVFGHHVPKETLTQEMASAGYLLEEDLDFLPEQSFTIYSSSAA